MWRKQGAEEGLEVQRHDFDNSFSWEEQAFAEDSAAVWPPRSYSCSFCRREFRSAQALGGHMNVHRRDRARLKQPPANITIPQFHNPFTNSSLAYDHLPNPNRTYSTDPASDSKPEKEVNLRISCGPRVTEDKDRVGIGILDEGSLNFDLGRSRSALGLFDDDGREEMGTGVSGCKRRKTDDEASIRFYVKSSSLVERPHHHRHPIESEVIELSSSSLHDLDLELRLGGLS